MQIECIKLVPGLQGLSLIVFLFHCVESSTHDSLDSPSVAEPVTEQLNIASEHNLNALDEQEYRFDSIGGQIGIITCDSDDESISISLPSNAEDSNKLQQIDSFLNIKPVDGKDNKAYTHNKLKKEILKILSTDDEEDEIHESPRNEAEADKISMEEHRLVMSWR